METKRIITGLIIFFAFGLFNSYAQTQEFFLEFRFVQRLSWRGDNFALHYEVLIEREENGVFRRLLQEFTTGYSVEVSLSPGKYRYQVIPYDFLEKQGTPSAWIEFEVRPAYTPKLNNYILEMDITQIDHSRSEAYVLVNQFFINITGSNINSESRFTFTTADNKIVRPDKIDIMPVSGAENDVIIRLAFNNPYSVPQIIEVHVINPGGMEARMTISTDIPPPPPPPFKSIFVYAGVSWMPFVNTFGNIYWLNEINSIAAAGFRIGVTYRNRENDFIDFGAEAAVSWMNNDPFFWTANLNFLARKYTPDRNTSFNFRLGLGYSFLQTFDWDSLHVNAGASILRMISKGLYIEAGLDNIYWLLPDNNIGGLRPWIGAGWRF